MAADERKKDIMKHLQTTSDLNLSPKKSRTTSIESSAPVTPATPATPTTPETPVTPEIPVTPEPPTRQPIVVKQDERKRRVMNHLNLSSNDFNKLSTKSGENQRKKQIEEHLRKSMK